MVEEVIALNRLEVVVAVALLVLGSGCASRAVPRATETPAVHAETEAGRGSPDPSAPSADPLTDVEMMVDGPYYEDMAALALNTDAIVTATVLSDETEVAYPDFSSDDPQLNPYVGSGNTPSPEDIEAMGMVTTLYTLQVDDVLAGNVQAGSTITLVELGGLHGGVDHRVHGMSRLSDHPADVLFLAGTEDGRYETVGMDQGRLEEDGSGGYRSIDPDRGDLMVGSASELTQLTLQIDA